MKKKQYHLNTRFFPKEVLEKLSNIHTYPLTVLQAHSGFGKTTALNYYFEQCKREDFILHQHVFSSDRPSEMWNSFCKMIGTVDKERGEQLLAAGEPDEDSMPEIRGIFRELTCEKETYLVFDDFQMWKVFEPCAFMMNLSKHGNEKLHIVIVTHPYEYEEQKKLMKSANLYLMQEEDFSFSEDDVKTYYRQAGVPLSDAQLDEVMRLTGGWVMALYLQLESVINNGKFEQGDIHRLMEGTFWEALSKTEQWSLLCLSMLPRFHLEEAADVFGLSMADTSKKLSEKRFFIRYNQENESYYMHTLLLDFLKVPFGYLSQEEKKAIYLKAGEISDRTGNKMNTLRFFYLSGDWERLYEKDLTSQDFADIVDDSTAPMILDLLEHTSKELKIQYPKALVPLVFSLFFMGKQEELAKWTKDLPEIIQKSNLTEKEKRGLYGEMETLLSFRVYNRIDAMSAHHRKALEYLEGPAKMMSPKSTWTFGSPSILYMYWRESGKLGEELDQMYECMPYYYRLAKGHGTGAEYVMHGEAHLMKGELDEAEILAHRAFMEADSQHQNSIILCSLFLLGRIAILRGNKELYEQTKMEIKHYSRKNSADLCRYTYDLAKGFWTLLLGSGEDIAPWITEGKIDAKRLVIMTQPFAYILYGKMLLQKKAYQKYLSVYEYAIRISSIFPNLLAQLYLNIYKVQALEALAKKEEACTLLKETCKMAFADEIYLPFAENFSGIKTLLIECCGIREYGKIQMMAEQLDAGRAALGQEAIVLTPMEEKVYGLLEQGFTNQQIAKELFVSQSTVKKHVSNILHKYKLPSRKIIFHKK